MVEIPEETREGLHPSEQTMEPSIDLIADVVAEDEVLLCLDLLKMAQLANPIWSINTVVRLYPKSM